MTLCPSSSRIELFKKLASLLNLQITLIKGDISFGNVVAAERGISPTFPLMFVAATPGMQLQFHQIQSETTSANGSCLVDPAGAEIRKLQTLWASRAPRGRWGTSPPDGCPFPIIVVRAGSRF